MLGRSPEPLNGLDADDSGDSRDLEPVPGLAEVFFDGLHVEPAGDLLGGSDGEFTAGDIDEAAALERKTSHRPWPYGVRPASFPVTGRA